MAVMVVAVAVVGMSVVTTAVDGACSWSTPPKKGEEYI